MQLTFKEWLVQNGYSSAEEALAEYSEMDDVYPALCSEDCQVEPDGHCPHGAPSLLLALGII
jgi:ketopantoate reductase